MFILIKQSQSVTVRASMGLFSLNGSEFLPQGRALLRSPGRARVSDGVRCRPKRHLLARHFRVWLAWLLPMVLWY